MTFSELYGELITEAKEKYPNVKIIQNYNASHNMAHLSVSEVFEELDMLDYEREEKFKWSDNIGDVITDEVLEHVTEGFNNYMETIKF